MPAFTSSLRRLAVLAACLAAPFGSHAAATPKTVCTITVNSPDEKETFRRHLPPGDYRFVELVERGRKDWLASACEQKVSCDVLIISGHFDGGDEFYTDRYDVNESLSVDEMERASCNGSCPGVFANLKEVYLFGCNTLQAEPHQLASPEIARALIRSGHSPAEAARLSAALGEQYGASNRDKMREIFTHVPVIYGFSSKAPLGRYAGPVLEKYFQGTPVPEIGSGQPSAKLLALFSGVSMTQTPGLRDDDPQARARADSCHFVDDRLSTAQKVAFVHEMLQRDMAEVRMNFAQVEHFIAGITPAQRFERGTAAAFAAIAADRAARERYLTFARDADDPAVRTRMMALARHFGWLTLAQEESEFVAMLAARIAQGTLGRPEVGLACEHGAGGIDDATLRPLAGAVLKSGSVAPAAALACLGDAPARSRVLRAMTSTNADDIAIAQDYLRRRPLTQASDVREITAAIARMPASAAQVRALETLAQQRIADPESLRTIAGLFPLAKSLAAQRAIAQVLIRADHRVLGRAELAGSLTRWRIKSPDGDDVIDALLRVLQQG